MSHARVGIVMGSNSDFPTVKPCLEVLESFGIPAEVRVISAHRSPAMASEYARTARDRGLAVIIAAAGLSAHLPGVLASQTTLPVIGIPVESGPLRGLDALYSIVQMPPGVPVATVGINAAKNAGLLAVEILAVSDGALAQKLADYRKGLEEAVLEKDRQFQS